MVRRIIALGFAPRKRLYYGRTFIEIGFSGLLLIGFQRGVLSPFAHSLFTSMTGIECGISRETHNRGLRIVAPVLAISARCSSTRCGTRWHRCWRDVFCCVSSYLGPLSWLSRPHHRHGGP